MVQSVTSLFRERPGTEPSGKTPIRGPSRCTAAELAKFAERRRQPVPESFAYAYFRLGERYGIRGDIAFCQALYETRALAAGRVRPIGEARMTDLWGLQGRDELFSDAFVEMHLQLLYGFAVAGPLPEAAGLSVPRLQWIERKGWRGKAPHWEDLNGKWSYPGTNYGRDIAAIWRNLLEWSEQERGRAERHRQAGRA
jgi:hypothetical protein